MPYSFKIRLQFLKNPKSVLNTGCAQNTPPLDFYGKSIAEKFGYPTDMAPKIKSYKLAFLLTDYPKQLDMYFKCKMIEPDILTNKEVVYAYLERQQFDIEMITTTYPNDNRLLILLLQTMISYAKKTFPQKWYHTHYFNSLLNVNIGRVYDSRLSSLKKFIRLFKLRQISAFTTQMIFFDTQFTYKDMILH